MAFDARHQRARHRLGGEAVECLGERRFKQRIDAVLVPDARRLGGGVHRHPRRHPTAGVAGAGQGAPTDHADGLDLGRQTDDFGRPRRRRRRLVLGAQRRQAVGGGARLAENEAGIAPGVKHSAVLAADHETQAQMRRQDVAQRTGARADTTFDLGVHGVGEGKAALVRAHGGEDRSDTLGERDEVATLILG